jgi:hypothetical protein
VVIEKGAGKIEPLLDVDRMGGVGQGHAHLLSNGHEEVAEDLEQHRIGPGAEATVVVVVARNGGG